MVLRRNCIQNFEAMLLPVEEFFARTQSRVENQVMLIIEMHFHPNWSNMSIFNQSVQDLILAYMQAKSL